MAKAAFVYKTQAHIVPIKTMLREEFGVKAAPKSKQNEQEYKNAES